MVMKKDQNVKNPPQISEKNEMTYYIGTAPKISSETIKNSLRTVVLLLQIFEVPVKQILEKTWNHLSKISDLTNFA